MSQTSAYGAAAADQPLISLAIERREPGPRDVSIEILYCGVCHSDLHTARGEWGQTEWPIVPGHEIVGRVSAVGAEVEGFAVGDLAGVGCLVDSCRTCAVLRRRASSSTARTGRPQTYGGVEKETGRMTHGGYSNAIVVDQDFVLHISADVDLAATAPLLCAGITTYSPLRHWGVGPGTKVGVVGLGGLGHMAREDRRTRWAPRSPSSPPRPARPRTRRALGADEVVISTDRRRRWPRRRSSLDLIIDTVAAPHDLDPYLNTLKRDGALVLVGAPPEPHPVARRSSR